MSASQVLTPYTLSIARGDGLVARFGDVVMYIADPAASADRLLSAVHSEGGDGAALIAPRLADVVFRADSIAVSPFGVLAPASDGLLVLLRGNVVATIDTSQGTHELSGERAFTWVEQIVSDPMGRIAITSGGVVPVTGCPHTDLRSGVVPGGGFVLCREAAEATAPSRGEPTATARAEPAVAETVHRLEATQAAGSTAAPSPARKAPAETSTYAPVAGVLKSADGAVYPLDRNYVIGRDPLRDEAVRNATSSPISVRDDQHVSRVHAHVSVEGATVFVRDAATPGGTFIAAPGAEDWTRISTTPTELEPGWSLRVGEQILTYHSEG